MYSIGFLCRNVLLVASFNIFENERIYHFCFRHGGLYFSFLLFVSWCHFGPILFKRIRIQISLATRLNYCWYLSEKPVSLNDICWVYHVMKKQGRLQRHFEWKLGRRLHRLLTCYRAPFKIECNVFLNELMSLTLI